MDNASRMRIICDPFKKEIEYQWYDYNIKDYVEFDPENSKLASEEFVYATIQNRAYEIVDLINRECNVGNVGLEIRFVGTKDDYDDFCNVIKNFYADANIKCKRDELFYNAAGDVMPKIKQKFSEVKKTLEEYTEEKIAKLMYKYNDAVKPSISLCVMGLYSAGKSAFINSIIGSEVLPSASDPTTAKVCKIYCDKKYEIRFLFDENECVLTFEGTSYKPNSNFDKEIIKELQSIVETDTRHEVFHMNRALDILNKYTSVEHKISDIIEIRIPFNKTSLPIDTYDFVIYDTPGSNSDNNVRHFEVLKDSLDEQTNALPIFITTPDTMDANDNNTILDLIEKRGAALDTTNAIVVVNKADGEGPNDLKKKSEKIRKNQDLRITKWKSTRIFFLPSLIAIASKKNHPEDAKEWLDEDMFEKYDEKEQKYSSDKRKLFQYNIVDKSKSDDNVKYSDDKKTTHLYKNSGLESIEKEIIEYACRYALYNKCQQASVYLQDAINLCVENVEEAEERLKAALEEAKGKFDSKKKNLCDDLENKKKDIGTYNKEFQELLGKDFTKFIKENNLQDSPDDKRKTQEKLKERWKNFKETEKKGKKDKNWASLQMQQYTDDLYNRYLTEFSQEVNNHIGTFWDKKSDQFKANCKNVVHGSDALTVDQKQILESIMLSKNNMSTYRMNFNLRLIGAIQNKHFLFWELKSEKFDDKVCCNRLIQNFNDAVRRRSTTVISTNEKNFNKWTEDLINILIKELCRFNSDLNSYEQKIKETTAEIESKKKCEQMLNQSKEYIDELLSIQGGVDNV